MATTPPAASATATPVAASATTPAMAGTTLAAGATTPPAGTSSPLQVRKTEVENDKESKTTYRWQERNDRNALGEETNDEILEEIFPERLSLVSNKNMAVSPIQRRICSLTKHLPINPPFLLASRPSTTKSTAIYQLCEDKWWVPSNKVLYQWRLCKIRPISIAGNAKGPQRWDFPVSYLHTF